MAINTITPISESLYVIGSSSYNPYLISCAQVDVGQELMMNVDEIQILSSSVEYLSILANYGIDPNEQYLYCASSSIVTIDSFNSSSYIINNVGNRCISINPCGTYELQVNSPGQPLWIQYENIEGYNSASVYNEGITNNGIESGSIFIELPNESPEFLYYVSENSPNMKGAITIGSKSNCYPPPSPVPSPTPTPTVTPTVTPSLTPSVSPSAGSVRVHVLGDPDVATVASTISSHLSGRGYTANVTSQVLGTAYTGADLSTSLYDVVVMYTNGGHTGATTLSSNISAFQSAGGHFVAATFLWNVYAAGFDFGLTPWVGGVGQTSSAGVMDNIVAHPITIGVNPTLSAGSLFMNTVTTLQSGGTLLASYQSGQKCLAIRTVGSSNQVGINAFFNGIQTLPNLQQLVGNSILWTVGLI
jgi:hypothetical protein